jgi:hypothetical protein
MLIGDSPDPCAESCKSSNCRRCVAEKDTACKLISDKGYYCMSFNRLL